MEMQNKQDLAELGTQEQELALLAKPYVLALNEQRERDRGARARYANNEPAISQEGSLAPHILRESRRLDAQLAGRLGVDVKENDPELISKQVFHKAAPQTWAKFCELHNSAVDLAERVWGK